MSPHPLVRFSKVTLERDHRILDRIDWEIQPGEHWAVLGANGCGKTNLLRLIGRYQVPSSGEVSVLEDGVDFQSIRRRVGLVSAAIAQMIDARETGYEIVVSGRKAMINLWGKVSDDEGETARALLEKVGACQLADRAWGRLSQGERQRLLVARALMNPVELLLLDEPCAGLDPAARENFLGLIDRIASGENAPSVVLVTHHVEEVTPTFSHTLILGQDGQTESCGPTSTALTAEALGRAFHTNVHLSTVAGRYHLRVERDSGLSF